jgi:uncharacterized protein YndB with AHSA1/START domain
VSGAPIVAEWTVPAPPESVFEFLSDLENHWALADRFIEVVELECPAEGQAAQGGTVRMRGPLGSRRTARTRVVSAEPTHSMRGTATLSGGTSAHVHWLLSPTDGGTRVGLTAELERVAAVDRLLLASGGRRWLRRRFHAILETLADRFAVAPVSRAL